MTIKDLESLFKEKFASAPFSVRTEEIFSKNENVEDSFTVSIALRKNDEIVMVVVEVSEGEWERQQAMLWEYCHDAWYYLLFANGKMVLKERPYIKTIEPKQMFSFDTPNLSDLLEQKEVDFKDIEKIMNNFDIKKYKSIPIPILYETIKGLPSYHIVSEQVEKFFQQVKSQNEILEFSNAECWLHPFYENKFMQCLLGMPSTQSRLFKYTSFHSLQCLLENATHSMSSLSSMNDTTEVDYAKSYLCKKGVDEKLFVPTTESVNTYIVSLAENKVDDLTMWRLYGDNAKGVSIEYENPKDLPEYFFFAKVCYADSKDCHPKLDFIRELLTCKVGERSFRLKQWGLWQHFFKPYEYVIENEVRLLFFGTKFENEALHHFERKWIQTADGVSAPIAIFPLRKEMDKEIFPLKIKSVILGNCFPEKKSNVLTLKVRLSETLDVQEDEIEVCISKIDNYR